MRIALLHPTYWPEVRRGSERLAHDLGVALAARGHEVTLLTAHRGRRAERIEDGVRVVRGRRLAELPGMHWYDEHVAALPSSLRGLLGGRFDVVHALYPAEGSVARLAARLGGPPYVLSVHGVLNREYLVRRRHRLESLASAARDAAAVSALSAAAADPLRRYGLAEPTILPGGVVAADYAGPVVAADHAGAAPVRPTVLCPASLDDPRKRGELLLEAFSILRERLPEARLVLAGADRWPARVADPPPSGGRARGLPRGVESATPADTAELAAAYRSAAVTALPSNDEAFGLVLLESLAAGTPVVAARSGGCVEIVTDERVGRLFEPDDAVDLARALGEAIELGADDATVARCRAHAAAWDWSRIVERYEAVYETAARRI